VKPLGPALCFALLLSIATFAADETVLSPANMGLVRIACPDGARLMLHAAAMGPEWAYSDYTHSILVAGLGADQFQDGQTALLPIRSTGGKQLEVFAKLEPDPKDTRTLRFTYRFTARETTPISSAYVVLRLPIQPYAGQPLEVPGGKALWPTLPVEPPQKPAPNYMANGTAKGVAVAPEQPFGFRIELDDPHWCMVNDERYWNARHDYYTVQLCAVVAAEGTTMQAGQSAEVKGTVRFNAPIRVADPVRASPPPTSLARQALRPNFTDLAMPRLDDATGAHVASAEVSLQPLRGDTRRPADPLEVAATAKPGAVSARGRLWSDAGIKTGFDFGGDYQAKPGELNASTHLVATQDFAIQTVWHSVWLSAGYVRGCKATFLGRPDGRSLAFVLSAEGDPLLARIVAKGVRIEADGKRVLEISDDIPRHWEVWSSGDGYVVREALAGTVWWEPCLIEKGATYDAKLKITWDAP
jgi:hypothetical protein